MLNSSSGAKSRKVVIIVQARMGSTRLPGKVLKPVLGKPLLGYQTERLKRVKNADALVLATSRLPNDDAIEAFAEKANVPCFRGDEGDVLDRYYRCARRMGATAVVRSTADCPLIDPGLVEALIAEFLRRGDCHFGSNSAVDRTYPRGLDAEIMSFSALQQAARQASLPYDREHVTPFIITRPKHFPSFSLKNDQDMGALRWTVDTPEDFEFVKKVIEGIYPANPEFSWRDILRALKKHPEWSKINSHIQQKVL